MHVDKIVGRLTASERLLANALLLVSDRHRKDPEVRQVARTIAAWSAEHVDALGQVADKHGIAITKAPDLLRAALFRDGRAGGLGLVEDLHDLALLAQDVQLSWTELRQTARALLDRELEDTCARAGEQTKRQVDWIVGQIKVAAPQAIAVSSEKLDEIETSVPRTVSAAVLPNMLWAPFVPVVLLAMVGAVALAAGQPLLLPSLGPSAYIMAVESSHPASRPYNTIAGHVIGLAAGFAMVFLFGAYDDPDPLAGGGLTFARTAASALSVGITVALALALKADHPPAGATALLVTLGGIRTMPHAIGLVVGACVLALAGVALQTARSGRLRRKQVTRRGRRLEPELRPS